MTSFTHAGIYSIFGKCTKLYVSKELFAPIMIVYIILQLHKHSISIGSQNFTFSDRVKKQKDENFPMHILTIIGKANPKWSLFSELVT